MSEVLLSDEVTVKLQQLAAQVGETPVALAERVAQAYRAQHNTLHQQYAGRYIAMYQGRVVDDDSDQLALLARIEKQYPDQPVLITPVLAEPEETLRRASVHWRTCCSETHEMG